MYNRMMLDLKSKMVEYISQTISKMDTILFFFSFSFKVHIAKQE